MPTDTSKWKKWAKGIGGTAGWCAIDPASCLKMGAAIFGMGGKKGGRVTARGIGVAKRGFGKALRKK